MNARTIKKKLMRNRRNAFFGKRAFLSLIIPYSLLNVESPPVLPKEWGEECGTGFFEKISFYCFATHKPWEELENYPVANFRYPSMLVTKYGISQYEAWETTGTKEELDLYIKYHEWHKKIQNHPLINCFDSYAFKTFYVNSFDEKRFLLTLSVKWFYVKRKLLACRIISKFIKDHTVKILNG